MRAAVLRRAVLCKGGGSSKIDDLGPDLGPDLDDVGVLKKGVSIKASTCPLAWDGQQTIARRLVA
eukprot:700439-Alexandrium_andersonii.AAC.1